MEKFLRRRQRVQLPHRLVAVNGEVAEVFNDFDFGKNRRADGIAEGRGVNERAEVVLIGKF